MSYMQDATGQETHHEDDENQSARLDEWSPVRSALSQVVNHGCVGKHANAEG